MYRLGYIASELVPGESGRDYIVPVRLGGRQWNKSGVARVGVSMMHLLNSKDGTKHCRYSTNITLQYAVCGEAADINTSCFISLCCSRSSG
jgi:hypothetical protein